MDLKRAIIYYSIFQHLVWGIFLLFSTHALEVNGLGLIRKSGMSADSVGIMLIAVSLASVVSLCMESTGLALLLLMFQQVVLMLSMCDAIWSTIIGAYADGTKMPRTHIFPDQIHYIGLALGHTWAMLDIHAPFLFSREFWIPASIPPSPLPPESEERNAG